MTKRLGIFVVGVCWAASVATEAWGCPNCKDTLGYNDPTASGMVQGYFWSILFLLSMPFSILAGLSSYFYLLVRRARREAAAAAVERFDARSEARASAECVAALSDSHSLHDSTGAAGRSDYDRAELGSERSAADRAASERAPAGV